MKKNHGFYVDQNGRLVEINPDLHIRQSIRSIAMTYKGERHFYPTLGSDLRDYQSRIIASGTFKKMETSLLEALLGGEKRIDNVDVKIERLEVDHRPLIAQIRYQIKGDGNVYTLKIDLNM